MKKRIADHPVWLAGFRPFFILAFASGVLLPFIWAIGFSGHITLSTGKLSIVQWHAHEMFYGFGWAVLGGFLLTASKNWVKVRGIHGSMLAMAAGLWLLERFTITSTFSSTAGRFISTNLFLLFVAGYVFVTLLVKRKSDTFRDNYFFLIALPLFLIAKNLVLSPDFYSSGVAMTIGLFRLAFAVMFERTVTQFMKNSMSIDLLRNRYLDNSIKVLVLISVFQAFMPSTLAAIFLGLAGLLLLVRFFLWKPLMGIRFFGNSIMYIGYLGLTVHFLLESFKSFGIFVGIGSLSTHVFTFLCMGVVIPGMLIRISQGHTGRKLIFTASDRLAISAMLVGAFFRVIATQIWPSQYNLWVLVAGLSWSFCFLVIGIRLTPFLLQSRVDGKVH